MPTRDEGVWLAFYYDLSDFAVFDAEIDALRWAVERQASVKFLAWGEGRTEALAIDRRTDGHPDRQPEAAS